MLAFLLAVEIGARLPDVLDPILLVLRVAAPLGFFVFFFVRGRYPELSGAMWGGLAVADVAVGLLGALFWMAPVVFFDSLRPDDAGFDANQLGEEGVGLTLFLRFAGYAGVTPFVEELFVRSWLLRYVDVVETRRDFRTVPIAHFTWRSFIVVTLYFVFSHADWEWGVMAAWTLLTMGWFYYRGHLAPLVLVHAVTNGAIFFAVVFLDGVFTDAGGAPISLWFFL
jgi:CAAX prenyl protease-like protein